MLRSFECAPGDPVVVEDEFRLGDSREPPDSPSASMHSAVDSVTRICVGGHAALGRHLVELPDRLVV